MSAWGCQVCGTLSTETHEFPCQSHLWAARIQKVGLGVEECPEATSFWLLMRVEWALQSGNQIDPLRLDSLESWDSFIHFYLLITLFLWPTLAPWHFSYLHYGSYFLLSQYFSFTALRGFFVCLFWFGFYSAKNQTQGLIDAKQALYQWAKPGW